MTDARGATLRVEGVAVTFGGVNALTDVSFEVGPGRVLGLIGPNGAGKTTLFDVISGFTEPSRGRVFMDGLDMTAMPAEARSAAGLGRSFQDARLFPSLTVKENLEVAFERYIKLRGLAAIAGGISAQRAEERSVAGRAEALIELMGWRPSATSSSPSFPPAAAASWTWRWSSPTGRGCCCWTSPPAGSPSAKPRRWGR